MNHLLIGTADKTEQLLQRAKPPFLLIDDGEIADAFMDMFPNAKPFNTTKHSFNPLKGMKYPKPRDFAAALYTASPEGKDTLTVRNGKRALAKILVENPPKRLNEIEADRDIVGSEEAVATVKDILLSPVLYNVLCNPTNFFFKGNVVATLNRAELGDFDAFILACLLIGQVSKGHQIIVPDFGFYGRDFHISLIRQKRLLAGVNYLAELPPHLRREALLIADKEGEQTMPEDALELARFGRLTPGTVAHTEFVQRLVG